MALKQNKIEIHSIVRTKRKTIGIKIDKDANVKVRAPLGIPLKEIDKIVETKRDWIEKKLAEIKAKSEKKLKVSYKDKAVFYFLGKPARLIITDSKDTAFEFRDNKFRLSRRYLEHAPDLFSYYYKEKAKGFFNYLARDIAKHVGVSFNNLRISNAKKRWGSCSSKGNLNINWRLIMAPEHVIEYIMCHEITHLIELNHSRRFWEIVSRLDPDYQLAEQWLKDHSYYLEFDF